MTGAQTHNKAPDASRAIEAAKDPFDLKSIAIPSDVAALARPPEMTRPVLGRGSVVINGKDFSYEARRVTSNLVQILTPSDLQTEQERQQFTLGLAAAVLAQRQRIRGGSGEGPDGQRMTPEEEKAENARIEKLMEVKPYKPTSVFEKLKQKVTTWGAIASVGLMGMEQKSSGCLEPAGANDAEYLAYGTQYQGKLLGFRLLVPGVGTGKRDTSATYLDEWNALTAAHNIVDLLQYNPTYELCTGNNASTNRGTIVPIASITIYPWYVYNNWSGPDIAVIHFAQPLHSCPRSDTNSMVQFQPATIAPPPAIDQVANSAGFGNTTTVGGTPARDYGSRAWNATVSSLNPPSFSSQYYFSTSFWPDGLPMNGKELSGDSGGPCYDSNGNLIGIHIGQSGNGAETGLTAHLRLSETNVMNFINQSRFAPKSLKIQPQGTNVIVSWSGSGVLQSATSVDGPYADVPSATSPSTNSTTTASSGFFRLRP